MSPRHEKRHRVVSMLRRRGLPLTMIAALAVALQASDCNKSSDYYAPVGISLGGGAVGDILGTVTVDGSGQAGVTVTLRQGTTVIATRTTDTNGEYDFRGVATGTYTVSVGSVSGASCPEDRTATVLADQSTDVDFPCTSQPTTGTVTGTVTLDGSPVGAGVAVALDGRTATTDANGMFSFATVDPGSYGVTASISGADCQPQTTTVSANTTSMVTIPCTTPGPSGAEIAGVQYSLMGTIIGTDACGLGNTISNPGPITILVETIGGVTFLIIISDAQVRGVYVIGQPWTGTGETTISSGTMTFTLRETVMGTWVREGGVIMLTGTLLFEILDGTTKVCESRYNATYMQLTASSHRFKTGVTYLLPGGRSILGLRPVAYRYLASHGDPRIPRLGLIAEDVARVFPAAVGFDAAGRPWGIAYGELGRLVLEEIGSRTAAEGRRWLERVAGRISPG